VEVRREKLDAQRVRQLTARQMLRGDLERADLEDAEHETDAVEQRALERDVEDRLVFTTLEKAQSWARRNALWPLGYGTACCAIEMITTAAGPRADLSRFGAEVVRASPRQADLLILSGRLSIKWARVARRLYDQMLEPKWVISMGACASSAGMFNNYALIAGADKFLPVDVYVPGCPPRPEALIYGVMKLQDKIAGDPSLGWRERYRAEGTEERFEGTEGRLA
jgi:NADH-quinone oxidoreductase subunit B